ncbi:YrrS family protein [Ornithinibacillus sp. JPR2-1]|uniref:YrrS family protein n=1 Tax=Ornithinibacillus sp. JPR2-1 TaxID=2094019 RepID=UPI0031DCC3BA
MSEFDRKSRVNKFEKRRKNTKLMSILIVAACFLIILLLGLWIFSPNDKPDEKDESANPDQVSEGDNDIETDDSELEEESTETEENSSEEDEENNEPSEEDNSSQESDNQSVERKTTDPVAADDDNVISAFTADWQPVGTEQSGPHTVVFDDGSQDRIEMEKAILLATGLAEDDLITWWVKRGGDQQVIGTVSNRAETEIYRVYISWIDNQGWQPTLVEVLKENDEKWRFE